MRIARARCTAGSKSAFERTRASTISPIAATSPGRIDPTNPLSLLRTGTASGSAPSILTDLISTLPLDRRYTYVFNGVSQVLDHILVTAGAGQVQYQVVHINSEFTDQTSDHDPQVVRLTP